MINFPREFRALRGLPGYFWNVNTRTLFSIKIGGVLRELKLQRPFYTPTVAVDEHFYSLSKHGKPRIVRLSQIAGLLEIPHTIPVQRELSLG